MAANRRAESGRRRFPLYVHITSLFSALVLAAGAAIGWLGYEQSRDIALRSAEDSFRRIGASVGESLVQAFQPMRGLARTLASQPIVHAPRLEQRLAALPLIVVAFEQNPVVAAVYVGYADGGFFLVRPLADDVARRFFAAPADAAFYVQNVEFPSAGGRRALFLFFDASLREVGRRAPEDFDYDPRKRPWYALAEQPGELVLTEPYVFYTTESPGVTFALRTDAGSIVGIDVTLRQVSSTLAGLRTLPGMEIALFDGERRVLAHSDPARPVVKAQGSALSLATLGDLGGSALSKLAPAAPAEPPPSLLLEAAGQEWKATVVPLQSPRGVLSLGIALPFDELLVGARRIRDQSFLATVAILFVALPLTWWIARRIGNAMRGVTALASDIQQFKFGGAPAAHSAVLEVDQLAGAMNLMQDTIRRFLDIAASLVAERRLESLLRRVVGETASATGASGGAVFLADEEGRRLVPALAVSGEEGDADIALAPIGVSAATPVAEAYRTARTVAAPLTEGGDSAEIAALAGLGRGDIGTLTAIPLRDREGETTGVLVLPSSGESGPSPERVAFAQALSGTAAIAIENQRLLQARKELLDAFIRLVAGAIDEKSPYTGGHCQRVPELTLMLARAACDAREGPLRDFQLDDEEWEALQIASWLHDCGKVTTPEYVVDKSTKLEALHDRIHEIRMRFEVLKRDAEIECWKEIAGGGDRDAAREALERTWRALDDDFAFVARCNEGGEAMDDADRERLRRIADRTWTRTLDDRIGISHEEKARKDRTPPPGLPATERLLADKPEHVIARTGADRTSADERATFRMPVPELKYNRGELHNLSVGRGTLTEEERYVINHHIVQTIVMLSQLPFPKHLRQVPEIAGGHHEKVDGTGYPRRLRREEMSWTARMMAIADIFEALTASDRPYKKAKTLSEAIRIMDRMRRDGHIDPDLFELFLASGVYRTYGERFLAPEQLDEVDVSAHLSRSAPAAD